LLHHFLHLKKSVIIITGGDKKFPGFDILIIDNIAGEVFFTLIQTKYALKESSTKYGLPQITASLKHMRAIFRRYVSDYNNMLIYTPGIDPKKPEEPYKPKPDEPEPGSAPFITLNLRANQFRAVFVLMANTFSNAKNDEANGVIILNSDKLRKIYGPTIWNLIRP